MQPQTAGTAPYHLVGISSPGPEYIMHDVIKRAPTALPALLRSIFRDRVVLCACKLSAGNKLC